MQTTRLSTKGQIILPLTIRTARAWAPGTEFIVEETEAGVLLRPASPFPRTRVEDVAGCLSRKMPSKGKAKTLKEMDEGIAREVKRRHERDRY